jgi:fructose-specific phosphotransferase system IIC component
MKKKGWSFTDDGIVITLAYILLTFIPLYYAGIVGHPLNQIWGMDKIIFGSIAGAVMLFLAHWLHLYLKKKNNGKVFFPYQRVVIPVVTLLLTSSIFYILLKWWTT